MPAKPRLPPPVGPGDRVGVAALSGVVDPARLDRGLEALRDLGFEPVTARNLASRHGIFAGSDEERLAAFHELAADPSLKAILFARGGHGILRVLPGVDWQALQRTPRAYVGYSDLTPFLLEVVRRLGLVAFHGPMVAADLERGLDPLETRSLLGALRGEYPVRAQVEMVAGTRPAEGPLLGGCLSLLASTLGTPFAPALRHSLLFWEDDGEPLYRLDRMLNQLTLSGSLEGTAAMVVGRVDLVDEEIGAADLRGLLTEIAERNAWPVAIGCASGHCRPNLTLPLGMGARLEPGRAELIVGTEGGRSQ